MKSPTKHALRTTSAMQVQISMPVAGVLRDARHTFLGLCIDTDQRLPAAMMEADHVALCDAKSVPKNGWRTLWRQRRQPRLPRRMAAMSAATSSCGRVADARCEGAVPQP